ncbi:MAG: carbamoyl-phosphate synthase large subunit [Chloroflexota bacterium]
MIRNVLVIGSGPIVIGQAAEFDYSGTQACIACREAGVRSILVNSNPATIQTDPEIADTVYIEPLTVESIRQILELERPEGLIATVGGQTALNLAVALDDAGVLERYGVRVMGTGLDTIRRGEDRALFADTLRQAKQPLLPSEAVTSVERALQVAEELGYPVMCRSAYALGGAGSGFATNRDELIRQVSAGLRSSGSGQVLVERSVYGWSEVEYEVIRDSNDNCLIVCNMENIDPMGVHTGDSIVVAPSQTLSDNEYQELRAAARDVVRALRVEGACNVQFALNRENGEYYVIEVNPRLSRSSALASKATGYPIAKVATRIALGYALPDIRNDITGTTAFFEPALDYITIKIPRWPFDKFTDLPTTIGTSMRSTGEVMAIGRTFEEAMSKAIRSLDQNALPQSGEVITALRQPNGARLGAILGALESGWTPADVSHLTAIHPWFVDRLAAVVQARDDAEPRTHAFRMVDTCAAEFEARTPYFYSSTIPGMRNEATPLAGPKAIILGAGPIRIGQGVEFDYSTVHACLALRAAGIKPIIINNNPETVSTDYSTSDRLYFEPLDIEAVMAIVENERDGLLGVIPQFGGQTAIHLVQPLHERGVPLLGTQPAAIDAAEDRARTSAVLAEAGIPTPAWQSVDRWQDLLPAVEQVGFPALLRPSYVLSGRGMTVVRTSNDVRRYLSGHAHVPLSKPLLIDQFLEGATELDVDAVSDGVETLSVVMEQLEEAGVHSGDSAEVYPVQTVDAGTIATIEDYTRRIARAFATVGLMNIQYAVLDGRVYVLEVNPRASRSVPFAAKASHLPLPDLAVRAILGERLADMEIARPQTDRVCIKEVVLPFRIFPGLQPVLGPEMQSTGESMGIGRTFGEAYWKAWLGAGMKLLPFGGTVYLSVPDEIASREGERLQRFSEQLRGAGCHVVVSSNLVRILPATAGCEPDDVDVASISLAIVLGRTSDEDALLRRAVVTGTPYVSTIGALRGMEMALREGVPDLRAEAWGARHQQVIA